MILIPFSAIVQNLSAASGQITFLYGVALTFSALVAHVFRSRRRFRRPVHARPDSREVRDTTLIAFESETVSVISRDPPEGFLLDPDMPVTGQGVRDLVSRLAPPASHLADRVVKLVSAGVSFEDVVVIPEIGAYRVLGRLIGLRPHLLIERGSDFETELAVRLSAAERKTETLGAFRQRAEMCPVPAYETDPHGDITWRNAAADALMGDGSSRGTRAQMPPNASGLTQLRSGDGTDLGWVRIRPIELETGNKLVFVLDADAQVRAEESLQSFVSTMTETFAHLDVALAIFDRDRRLSLFNPALVDLFSLEPGELAMRPSLRVFLESLRVRRMVPEQRDFAQWRHQFSQAGAADGGYSEDWTLPSGQILRVTGQPHPKGATAYIFEDISGHVMLERRYIAEMELGQSMLDHLEDGIAVFGVSGEILLSNHAFEAMWSLNRDGTEPRRDIAALCERLEEASALGSMPDLVRLVVNGEAQPDREYRIRLADGGTQALRLRRLPDGSTLVVCQTPAAGLTLGEEVRRYLNRRDLVLVCSDTDTDRILSVSERAIICCISRLVAKHAPDGAEIRIRAIDGPDGRRLSVGLPFVAEQADAFDTAITELGVQISRIGARMEARPASASTGLEIEILWSEVETSRTELRALAGY